MMARFLKQSTAFTFRIGPFLDDTDGKTAETALTIAQADIQISKNGGAFAQTSDAAPVTTHDSDGWYQCPLTATDTNTLGPLTVQIAMAGALPVWEHFQVVPANVYDSMFGTDKLQVDVTQWAGTATTLSAATNLPEVDAKSISDNANALAQIADAVWTEILADHEGVSGATAEALSKILADIINKKKADYATGKTTVFKADGVTPYYARTVKQGATTEEVELVPS